MAINIIYGILIGVDLCIAASTRDQLIRTLAIIGAIFLGTSIILGLFGGK